MQFNQNWGRNKFRSNLAHLRALSSLYFTQQNIPPNAIFSKQQKPGHINRGCNN